MREKIKKLLREQAEKTPEEIRAIGQRIIHDIEGFYKETFESPYDVNCGYCDVWAQQFEMEVGGFINDTQTAGIEENDEEGYHEWVEYNGKYYDAEALEGVDRLEDLPYFQRNPF